MESEEYLRLVKKCVEQALIQTGKLSRCERHNEVLLHSGDESNLHVTVNLATIWLKNDEGLESVMQADLTDAIQLALGEASREGCPNCQRADKK